MLMLLNAVLDSFGVNYVFYTSTGIHTLVCRMEV